MPFGFTMTQCVLLLWISSFKISSVILFSVFSYIKQSRSKKDLLYSVLILFQITPSFPFMKQPSFPNLNHLLHGTLFDFAFETFSLSADNKLFFDCHKPLCTLVIFWQIFFFAVVIPYGLPSFYEWFVNGLTDDKIALQSPCCERKQSYVLDKICK